MPPGDLRVSWLPAAPAYGVVSFLRYWQCLAREAAGRPGLSVECPLGSPRARAVRRGFLGRSWQARVEYPLRLWWRGLASVVHLHAQSILHLASYLPRGVRTVVTVHDLLPLAHLGSMRPGRRRRYLSRLRALAGIDRIVVPTRHVGLDVERRLGVDPARLVVLPLGVATQLGPGPGTRPAAVAGLQGETWVLSLGTAEPRKGLDLLPRFLRALRARGLSPGLVRAGQALPAELATELGEVLEGRPFVQLGPVSDEVLGWLYRHAALLVFPSKGEGFGLPVLEAMSAGCPVVAARIPAVEEVAGAAAHFFAPGDAVAAAAEAALLLEDAGARASSVERGRARAGEFSWGRHLDGLVEVYRELAVAGPERGLARR